MTTIPFEQLFFLFFSAMLLLSASMVVGSRNAVQSALFLVLSFIASSGLWMLLGAEFLSLILILVYVGAVMTLFLFVVMTLNLDREPQSEGFVRYLPYGILVLCTMAGIMIYALRQSSFISKTSSLLDKPANYSNIKALGEVLYTYYSYPFELAGILLLIAIIAAISLDLRVRSGKKQRVQTQLAADPKRRIDLVKVSAKNQKDEQDFHKDTHA